MQTMVVTKITALCQAGRVNPLGGVNCHNSAAGIRIKISLSQLTALEGDVPTMKSLSKNYWKKRIIHVANNSLIDKDFIGVAKGAYCLSAEMRIKKF